VARVPGGSAQFAVTPNAEAVQLGKIRQQNVAVAAWQYATQDAGE